MSETTTNGTLNRNVVTSKVSTSSSVTTSAPVASNGTGTVTNNKHSNKTLVNNNDNNLQVISTDSELVDDQRPLHDIINQEISMRLTSGIKINEETETNNENGFRSNSSSPPLTVKDRMFLAIDKSAHLFTQTLTATPLLLSPEDDSIPLQSDLTTTTTTITNSINTSCLLTTSSSSESVAINNETSSSTSSASTKKKRVKKSKKQSEKENISVKSSFNKFDNLAKKNILHVRSSDADKAQEKFNGTNLAETMVCKQCSKSVFQMELVKAERANWHRNCFRCFECNKLLSGDSYESHGGKLYCKPHFKNLFVPKAIEDTDGGDAQVQRPELIIRENQPLELPPDVIRASNKSDLGLDELHSLNVKEKFQKFEKSVIAQTCEEPQINAPPTPVKRSASILSKLAKFQAKGFDIGISDAELNGIAITLSEDEDDDDNEEDDGDYDDDDDDDDVITNGQHNAGVIDSDDRDSGNGGDEINCSNVPVDDGLRKKKRKQKKGTKREKPFVFNQMDDMRKKWESGQNGEEREERREERKQELQSIRNRLFHGKQVRMKEAYQQAIENSCSGAKIKKTTPITPDEVSEARAQDLREIFERGETNQPKHEAKLNEDLTIFETGFSKQSRSLFLELDACASKNNDSVAAAAVSPRTPRRQNSSFTAAALANENGNSVVKHNDAMEDIQIETAEISNKFKFFETYQEPVKPKKQFRITPPREGQVKMDLDEEELKQTKRNTQTHEDPVIAKETHTATRMLNVFRKLEEDVCGRNETNAQQPPPLKRFTPPRDGQTMKMGAVSSSATETSDDDETDGDEASDDDDNDDVFDDGRQRLANNRANHDPGLAEAQKAARAKQLRAKFEKWELNETEKNEKNASVLVPDERNGTDSQIESTKVLRAKFENLTDSKQNQKPKIKVNRFV